MIMTKRGEKTRNGGRWTEAYFWGQIRQSIRRLTMYWRTGDDFLKTLRRPYKGPLRHHYEYPCQICQNWYKREDIELDHKVPCGSLKQYSELPEFFARAFVEQDGWNSLCKKCHKKKTIEERINDPLRIKPFEF